MCFSQVKFNLTDYNLSQCRLFYYEIASATGRAGQATAGPDTQLIGHLQYLPFIHNSKNVKCFLDPQMLVISTALYAYMCGNAKNLGSFCAISKKVMIFLAYIYVASDLSVQFALAA